MSVSTRDERLAFSPLIAVFFVSFIFLFLLMPRTPSIYDEGLIVTGAMRVAAGEVPHRDFYTPYGPAQFYLLAGLFKLFGSTLLVERLYDLFIRSTLLTVIFAVASLFCRRIVACGVYAVAFMWIFAVGVNFASPLQPVSLLNFVTLFLILPVFQRSVSKRRLLFAGMFAGISFLFRYDTGIALSVVSAITFVAACYANEGTLAERTKTFATMYGMYLLGSMIAVVPAFIYFLSVAPLHSFLFDIVEYPGKNYYRGRGLPFPALHLRQLGGLAVYTPIFVSLTAIIASLSSPIAQEKRFAIMISGLKRDRWRALLFTFGSIAFAMYFKGYVRVHPIHMYLSLLPSIMLLGVLFQFRTQLPKVLNSVVSSLIVLSALGSVGGTLSEGKMLIHHHATLAPSSLYTSLERDWCKVPAPLTRGGVCFTPDDDDRIQVIEFLNTHTTPNQALFEANSHNDVAFANDSLMYFASGLMPATHWSQFDPGLQNSLPIQTDMIQELDKKKPPYIVLDNEFDLVREPNDSWRSSGVYLLDNYIHSNYTNVAKFGRFAIWQRIDAAKLPSDGE